jgi:hypothetical protein
MSPHAPFLLVEDDANDALLIRRSFVRARVVNPIQVVSSGVSQAVNGFCVWLARTPEVERTQGPNFAARALPGEMRGERLTAIQEVYVESSVR